MAETVEIPLSRGLVAIIDAPDRDLANHRWHVRESKGRGSGYLYAVRWVRDGNGQRKLAYLHREIMQPSADDFVDHINGDELDNRRQNLRTCTRSQNAVNSKRNHGASQFRGVVFHKASGKWAAQIGLNGRKYHIGLFSNENDASNAYREKERELYGQFVREVD